MNKTLLAAACFGLLSVSANAAVAHDDSAHEGKEKCYGIADSGKNDCSSAKGTHACAGRSMTKNDPNDFVWVDQGECGKLHGTLSETKKH